MIPRKIKGVVATLLALITLSLAIGVIPCADARTFEKIARQVAKKYGVDASLVCAIINQESRWKQYAVSRAGAIGLMQIMPRTGRDACGLTKRELYDPYKNINCGVKYFRKQLKRFRSKKLALCAYNAGPHRVKKYNGCPPFKETKNYYRKILADWRKGKSCPSNKFTINNPSLSAKIIADSLFVKGNFKPLEWWRLVCKSIDMIYDIEMGKTQRYAVGKSAKTRVQINTWLKILDTTVNDIYKDERRLKGSGAMPKSRIKNNIINACPKGH